MGGLADGRVVHVEIVANGPYNHLAGIQSDPDLHLDAMLAAHLLTVAPDRLLHSQRRIAGPHGVVFMRNRRPKQGHNAIAHDLIHGAFVAVHGRHQALQYWVEELARLLRIAVSQQLHGAFEVGKEHRDLLAFAFEGSFGGEDFLGQVRRRIGVWSTYGLLVGAGTCHRPLKSPSRPALRRPRPRPGAGP